MVSARSKRWFDRLNESNHLLWLLGLVSFLETIILPIPIEVILIPLMAINRDRIIALATAATVGCLLAAVTGYAVGMVLYESIGTWFIETMGYEQAYESFKTFFDSYGFGAILLVGILPIPFQVAMITAGLSGYPLPLFVLAAVIARGIRYYGLAWLVHRFGDDAIRIWKRHALTSTLIAGAIIAALYFAGQWLVGRIM